ncbi:MAG: hypothetical protein PHS33_07815 [Candidatus Omnitrophica bacterium]|nr:hypothetical protein [Candidatus Omnitrophota bacterium]
MKYLFLILIFCFQLFGAQKVNYLVAGNSNLKFWCEKGGSETFLNIMKLQYPDYLFGTIEYVHLSAVIADIDDGYSRYSRFISNIAGVNDTEIIGGLIMAYGFVEGRSKAEADSFEGNLKRFINTIRRVSGNNELPVFLNRYDKNVSAQEARGYQVFAVIVDSAIINTSKTMKHVYIFPLRYMPSQRYIANDHHYDSTGHWLAALQIPYIIQNYNEDFWFK